MCSSAPRPDMITTSAAHHSVFTGWIPFLPPNQQRQSTVGKKHRHDTNRHDSLFDKIFLQSINSNSMNNVILLLLLLLLRTFI